MTIHDLIGLVGTGLIVSAYTLVQLERLNPTRPPALLMNLVGALMIVFSLLYDFNLSAFAMEAIWALVAALGLARHFLKPR
jgi:drug/metabolite transporter (DMT)-like permease